MTTVTDNSISDIPHISGQAARSLPLHTDTDSLNNPLSEVVPSNAGWEQEHSSCPAEIPAEWLVLCAWCARRMDAKHEPVGPVIENPSKINCSHGICMDCYAAMKRQIKERGR